MKVIRRPARGAAVRKAVEALRAADPRLGEIIARAGPCRIEGRRDPFVALAEAIIYQQLSMKAAETIWGRFERLFDGRKVSPQAVIDLHPTRLRSAGVSRQKGRYLRALARGARDKALDVRRLRRMGDDEIIQDLMQLPGIGRWSVEMFLIFCLKRPDVWPVGDLGLLKALQRMFGMRRLPSRERALALGERWRPYRSIATWYLWRSTDSGGVG
ncbi:MAG: DNA-3-methyladenine glycosylase 2 family protein [Acidobacteriota bacterium]